MRISELTQAELRLALRSAERIAGPDSASARVLRRELARRGRGSARADEAQKSPKENGPRSEQATHTPEPWEALRLQCAWGIQSTSESADPDERVCHLPYHFDYRGEPCGSITSQNKTNAEIEANARRIVACVNACEGIADPEKAIPALVEACHEALCVMMHYRGDATPLAMHPDDVADMARAAIALARGEG